MKFDVYRYEIKTIEDKVKASEFYTDLSNKHQKKANEKEQEFCKLLSGGFIDRKFRAAKVKEEMVKHISLADYYAKKSLEALSVTNQELGLE